MPGPARGGPALACVVADCGGMDAGLRVQRGGSGEPVLLLLHGLGATGEVWDGWRPLLARRWPGRWLRISGLAGLVAADAPAVTVGLREEHERWPRN